MTKAKTVLLGEVGAAHGIRGEFVVRSYTTDPARIAAYGPLEDSSGRRLPRLEVVRATTKGLICRFDGIADRTAAETMRGTQLWIPRDRLPPAEPGQYYHADLIGLTAVDAAGTTIGTVVAVANFGAGDLLEIVPAGGGQTEYLPFTDAAIPEVDIAHGRVVVSIPVSIEAREDDAAELTITGQGGDRDQSPG